MTSSNTAYGVVIAREGPEYEVIGLQRLTQSFDDTMSSMMSHSCAP